MSQMYYYCDCYEYFMSCCEMTTDSTAIPNNKEKQ